MSQSIDPNTRIITNKDKSEFLEIKRKRVLEKRIRTLEFEVSQLRAMMQEIKTSVV